MRINNQSHIACPYFVLSCWSATAERFYHSGVVCLHGFFWSHSYQVVPKWCVI